MNFPVESPGYFSLLIELFEKTAGNKFDQVRFVTSEDNETWSKNQKFYEVLQREVLPRNKLIVDIREYKQRSAKCRCGCKEEIKWKVQAEVDVAIAVYLIDYALCSYIQSITLFAGDRDFIDSIRYAQSRLGSKVTILGFEGNAGQPLLQSGFFVNVTNDILKLQKIKLPPPPPPKQQIHNPEVQSGKNKHHPLDHKAASQVIDHSQQFRQFYKEIANAAKTSIDPMKDPLVKSILKTKLPDKLTMIEGTYFKDMKFPEETIKALCKHPKVDIFEAEHAIYTTEVLSDLDDLVRFIFNTHDCLTGKID